MGEESPGPRLDEADALLPEWKTLTTVPLLTARWGESEQIDATRKWPEEDFTRPWPDEIVMDQGIKALVDRRWKEYGLE